MIDRAALRRSYRQVVLFGRDLRFWPIFLGHDLLVGLEPIDTLGHEHISAGRLFGEAGSFKTFGSTPLSLYS